MTARIHVRPSRFWSFAVVTLAMVAACAGEARANCFTTPPTVKIVQPRLEAQRHVAAQAAAATLASDKLGGSPEIVGMWETTFYADTPMGPKLWDQGFELFHDDGTEVSIDNAVPPSLGNVCVGVWRSHGARKIKLRHMAFNWNPDGSVAGTFLLLMTVTVGKDGRSYEGTFESDSFDVNGQVIPDLHAAGTVNGTRITVD